MIGLSYQPVSYKLYCEPLLNSELRETSLSVFNGNVFGTSKFVITQT